MYTQKPPVPFSNIRILYLIGAIILSALIDISPITMIINPRIIKNKPNPKSIVVISGVSQLNGFSNSEANITSQRYSKNVINNYAGEGI